MGYNAERGAGNAALPTPMLVQSFAFLTVVEMGAATISSQSWKRAADTDELWRLCAVRYNMIMSSMFPRGSCPPSTVHVEGMSSGATAKGAAEPCGSARDDAGTESVAEAIARVAASESIAARKARTLHSEGKISRTQMQELLLADDVWNFQQSGGNDMPECVSIQSWKDFVRESCGECVTMHTWPLKMQDDLPSESTHHAFFKFLFMGDSDSGKTALMRKLTNADQTTPFEFIPNSQIGIDFKIMTCLYRRKVIKVSSNIFMLSGSAPTRARSSPLLCIQAPGVGHSWPGEVPNDHVGLLPSKYVNEGGES